MSKEKQIEEMANIYYDAMLKARGTLGSMNEGAPKWYAKAFYNAGYRKQSEVTREIFEEIEKYLLFNPYDIALISHKTFDALKKKYTEGIEKGLK